MASITVPESLIAAPGLNRWDSPWLNPKFMSGLVMVVAVLLIDLMYPLIDPRISYQPR